MKVIYAVSQLKNGYFASSSADRKIILWNVNNGTLVATLIGHTSFVTSFVQLQDETLVSGAALPDKSIRVWNSTNGALIKTLKDVSSGVWSLATNSNGNLIIGDMNGRVEIRDSSFEGVILAYNAHSTYIFSMNVLSNGFLATASGDYTIKVWSLFLTKN